MTHFISVSLLVISVLLCQVHTQDIYFSATHEEVTALYKTEERLFSALDAFISEKEEHLKELENVLSKLATSRALSGEDIGEYLGNPLNQFHVVKRFVDDWGKLGEYLFSDRSTDDLLYALRKERDQIPDKAELDKTLRDLENSNGIDADSYRVKLSDNRCGF